MKKGITMISNERKSQRDSGYNAEHDDKINDNGQLAIAAVRLITAIPNRTPAPNGWGLSNWNKLLLKPYVERLAIAGGLLAAEIDRLQRII